MKLYLLFIVAIFSLNAYGQLTSAEQTKVDELFGAWNSNTSPDTALGVIRDGKLVYTKGYGVADLEHDIPITDTFHRLITNLPNLRDCSSMNYPVGC